MCHMAASPQNVAGEVKCGYVIITSMACVTWPVRYSLMLSQLSYVGHLAQFLSSLYSSKCGGINKPSSSVWKVDTWCPLKRDALRRVGSHLHLASAAISLSILHVLNKWMREAVTPLKSRMCQTPVGLLVPGVIVWPMCLPHVDQRN